MYGDLHPEECEDEAGKSEEAHQVEELLGQGRERGEQTLRIKDFAASPQHTGYSQSMSMPSKLVSSRRSMEVETIALRPAAVVAQPEKCLERVQPPMEMSR